MSDPTGHVHSDIRRHGIRGTRAGLAELIEAELGLTVAIGEPGMAEKIRVPFDFLPEDELSGHFAEAGFENVRVERRRPRSAPDRRCRSRDGSRPGNPHAACSSTAPARASPGGSAGRR